MSSEKKKRIRRKDIYRRILEDPRLLPATKLVLLYVLEVRGLYYFQGKQTPQSVRELDNIKDKLSLSDYHWRRVKKQLKNMNLVRKEKVEL